MAIAKKAFAEPIYMPTRDPARQGPPIHSIRWQTKHKSGIAINQGLASNGDMVRVDVFQRKGQFYLVPIYVHHFTQHCLPNRAIVGGKDEDEWLPMQDEEFIFSLYKNDLVRIVKKDTQILAYYAGTDRSNATINLRVHDNDATVGKDG